jgi:hypothetical protein
MCCVGRVANPVQTLDNLGGMYLEQIVGAQQRRSCWAGHRSLFARVNPSLWFEIILLTPGPPLNSLAPPLSWRLANAQNAYEFKGLRANLFQHLGAAEPPRAPGSESYVDGHLRIMNAVTIWRAAGSFCSTGHFAGARGELENTAGSTMIAVRRLDRHLN